MNVKNILCPVDFSESNERALAYASALAKENDAELHIVYAYEEPLAYTEGGFGGYVPPADMAPDKARLETVAPKPGVRFRRAFLIGTPSTVLLEYVSAKDIDLIVMGTHGRTGIGRLLMGSVAEAIVRKAPCPVLTLKAPDAKDVEHEKASSEAI